MQVILARNTETGEVVAIKRISIRNTSKPGLPDNVLREIKSLELMSNHPNVVRLIDVFPKVPMTWLGKLNPHYPLLNVELPGLPSKGHSVILVQEYCFSDLARLINGSCDRFPDIFIKGILQQILRGTHAIHKSGLGMLYACIIQMDAQLNRLECVLFIFSCCDL